MPTIVTRGAVSAYAYGFTSLGSKKGWITILYSTTSTQYVNNVSNVILNYNGTKYLYNFSLYTGTTVYYPTIELKTDGTINLPQQSQSNALSVSFDTRWQIIDGSNNLVQTSVYNGSQRPSLQGTNTSWSMVWAKYVSNNGPAIWDQPGALSVDSTGNIMKAGTVDFSDCCNNYSYCYLYKFNPSGTLLYSVYFNAVGFNGYNTYIMGSVYTANTSNVVTLAYYSSNTGNSVITALNPSQNVAWSVELIRNSAYVLGGLAITPTTDSNGYYYVVYHNQKPTQNYYTIVQWDSSGNCLWQRQYIISTIGTESVNIPSEGASIVCDSSGNSYSILSFNLNRSPYGQALCFVVLKYNSSGTLQWQRTFSSLYPETLGLYPTSCVLDPTTNSLIIGCKADNTGLGSSNGSAMVIKYPTDGSVTGTYAITGSTKHIVIGSTTNGYDSDPAYYVQNSNMATIAYTSTNNSTTVATWTQNPWMTASVTKT